MKFALINGERQEAQPNLSGKCPACDQATIAKCGEVKIWHWAHKGRRTCDPWWENETEWHRDWKAQFPVHWQEYVHKAKNGEKHVADVFTDGFWVIEFQHSPIDIEERQARNTFYKKLVWVLDGVAKKKDREHFLFAWKYGLQVDSNPKLRRIFANECALVGKWADSNVPIFIDFHDQQWLWWIIAKSADRRAYIAQFSRYDFIKIHCGEATRDFDELMQDTKKIVTDHESRLPAFP